MGRIVCAWVITIPITGTLGYTLLRGLNIFGAN
jgi:hypothetical protein